MSVVLIGSERPWSLTREVGDDLGEWAFSPGDSFEAMAGVHDDGRTLRSTVILMRDATLRLTRRGRSSLTVVRARSFLTRKEHVHRAAPGSSRSFLTPRCLVTVLADGDGTPFLHARYVGPAPHLALAGSPMHAVLSAASPDALRRDLDLLGPFAALVEEASVLEFRRETERRERLTNAERDQEDAAAWRRFSSPGPNGAAS